MQALKILDLFSGIGMFSYGLELTGGFETSAFCEFDPFRRAVLAKHWPAIPTYNDVRTLDVSSLIANGIAPDVLTGGFPCQDVSIGNAVWGQRLGLDGERSGLWREIYRILDDFARSGRKVRWVLLENVRELLGNGLPRVLGDLATLGYDAEWHAIPASRVGSLQNRDRVWIIAYPSEIGIQGLFQSFDFSAVGQRWACGQKDLPSVLADPFAGDRWPKPLVRRGIDRGSDWVDRIKALGDTICPYIPEMIGYAILEAGKKNIPIATQT